MTYVPIRKITRIVFILHRNSVTNIMFVDSNSIQTTVSFEFDLSSSFLK